METTELLTASGRRLRPLPGPRQGGQSVVHAALDEAGRQVAVKVALHPGSEGAWLDEERRLLQQLAAHPELSPRLCVPFDHGTWAGRPFYVAPWCERTLASEILSAPLPRRLALATALAEAVAALHAAHPTLVHRDLKPSNVLLDEDGGLRLGDFGGARGPSLPGDSTSLLFTDGYAPPEQTLPLGCPPDRSWDVHALAATLFYCVVGRGPAAPAHNALRLTAEGHRVAAGRAQAKPGDPARYLDLSRMQALEPADLGALRALVDGPLAQALQAALQPDPARRSGSAETLAAALRHTGPRPPDPPARSWHKVGLLGATLALTALALTAGRALDAASTDPHYPAVPIAPGTFLMDGPQPVEVTVSRALLVGEPVTQGLWTALTGEVDPLLGRREYWGGMSRQGCTRPERAPPSHPAAPMGCVDWFEAVAVANALSDRHGLAPAYQLDADPRGGLPTVRWDPRSEGWRLLTDAEWELAARRAFAPGTTLACLGLPGGPGCPSERFPRSEPFYGVAGFATWIWDWHAPPTGGLDPAGPEDGTERVARGGIWTDPPLEAAIKRRGRALPTERRATMGLRLARLLPDDR